MPTAASTSRSSWSCRPACRRFAEALRAGTEIFHALRGILKKAGHSTGVGDEGGFAPNLRSNREALDLVLEAVRAAGLKAGDEVFLALDVASSEFWKRRRVRLQQVRTSRRDPQPKWLPCTRSGRGSIPIVSIEDGVAESDWDGWKALTRALGDRVQLVGDDVFVTNPEILKKGIAEGVGNALLVKLNQIGTVTETLDAMALARQRRVRDRDLAPIGRNRRHDDRRPRRRHVGRADQDRIGQPQRPHREIQPAAADRRGAGIGRALRGPRAPSAQLART